VLKKENRIGKKREVLEVKEEGEFYAFGRLGIIVLDKGDNLVKFGWIISKKVSKKACERNRARRIIAEALRMNYQKWIRGYRVIFLVKKSFLGIKLSEAEREIGGILRKLNEKNNSKNTENI
jgi:ribonuclease P protein component